MDRDGVFTPDASCCDAARRHAPHRTATHPVRTNLESACRLLSSTFAIPIYYYYYYYSVRKLICCETHFVRRPTTEGLIEYCNVVEIVAVHGSSSSISSSSRSGLVVLLSVRRLVVTCESSVFVKVTPEATSVKPSTCSAELSATSPRSSLSQV